VKEVVPEMTEARIEKAPPVTLRLTWNCSSSRLLAGRLVPLVMIPRYTSFAGRHD